MSPSTQDRILSALAHLAALAFGSGVVVPAALWSESRQKSAYVRFQTLQAFGYQSLGYTLWMLGALLVVILLYAGLVLIALFMPDSDQNDGILLLYSLIIVVILFGSIGLYLLIPLIGAVLCALGKDFRYPLLGGRLARSLGYQPQAADHSPELDSAFEERFAAAMGHFAVILPIWGMLAPAWLWISHKAHSPWLKFQSAQTTLYQIIVNMLYFGLAFLGILIGIAVGMLFSILSGPNEFSVGIGMLTASLALSCFSLIIPLFHLLGQWAGLQTLRGRDFNYPIIGHWLNKREAKV